MFFGGIFIFGTGGTRQGAIRNIIIGIINMVMGFIPLGFGIYYKSVLFIVLGSIIAGLGLLMVIISTVGFIRLKNSKENDVYR